MVEAAGIAFNNVRIFDGSGDAPFPGAVLVRGDRIVAVSRGSDPITQDGVEVVDGGGATLMPGLVEGHAHLTYPTSIDREQDTDVFSWSAPVEKHAYIAAHNAKTLLRAGFTSAYSAGGATQTMETSLRDEINGGWAPGPRLRAAGTEGQHVAIPGVGGEAATDAEAHDPAYLRSFIRETAAGGADVVKFILSGFIPPNVNKVFYSDAELQAAGEEARECGVWLTAHAQPLETIKQALRYGFRVLYHADMMDEEAFDLAEARRDEIFIGPSFAYTAYLAENHPVEAVRHEMTEAMHLHQANMQEMVRRGIRFINGGDYGFKQLPTGTNANDLVYFVERMGLTAAQALVAATRWGGELMSIDKLGMIREGWLADILLVDGDAVQDISVLKDRKNLSWILKGGEIVKAPARGPRPPISL